MKYRMPIAALLGGATVCVSLVSGCMSAPYAPRETYVKPKYVSMLTEGVTIRAADGSWAISGSDPVPPPFYSDARGWDPNSGDILDRYTSALRPTGEAGREAKLRARKMAAQGREAVEEAMISDAAPGAAQRVYVEYPGLAKPLYGVLAIYPINTKTNESSAKRAYRMAVPASYVSQAKGARISVVFQPYKIPRGRNRAGGLVTADRISWILWMSDAPFAGHRAQEK